MRMIYVVVGTMFLVIMCRTLTGCSCEVSSAPSSVAKVAEAPSPFKMNCTESSHDHVNIYRCENEEAVCYSGYSHDSVSCHWKPVVK